MTGVASKKIGLILGSTRLLSNTAGLSTYVQSVIASSFPTTSIEEIHLANSPGHPLPLLLEPLPPAGHSRETLPDAYADAAVRQWSATVLSWDGVIILTPQYNWGVPAPLKNALDQIFNEWHEMPCALMTAGGRGGTKVLDSLKTICGGGLDMTVVDSTVEFKIPRELIASPDKRIEGDEEWLKEGYTQAVMAAVRELLDKIEEKAEKQGLLVAQD